MGFFQHDDNLILMDYPKANNEPINRDELIQLNMAGIKTALMCMSYWSKVEQEKGKRDFGTIDRRVDQLQNAGFKVVILSNVDVPFCFPEEWYAKINNGTRTVALNPWCADAQEYVLDYYRTIAARYNTESVLVALSNLTMGETAFLNEPGWYTNEALLSFRNRWNAVDNPRQGDQRTDAWLKETLISMMTKQQTVLANNPHREIWTMLHPEIANQPYYGNGCNYIYDFYNSYMTIPDVHINQIWYTWIQHTRVYSTYQDLIARYKLQAFGGAEYCEGLEQTAPAATHMNMRGLLIGPFHPFANHLTLEPWMIEKIRWANQILQSIPR